MKLWHDDVRPPPEGWVWARTNMEAKKYLRTGQVEEISMDHDLGLDHIDIPEEVTTEEFHQFLSLRGDGPHTGLQLVRWMLASNLIPKKITIHSWNPAGADSMRAAFEKADIGCAVIPFIPPGGFVGTPRATIITPLQVVVDLLKDALISIEGGEKEMAITQIRQAVELIKVSDGGT